MGQLRRVWSETAVGSYASLSGLALSYVTTPLITRALGPIEYGQLGAALAWVTLFATLLHLSLGQAVVHDLSRKDSASKFTTLFGSVLALVLFLSVGGVCAIVALWYSTGGAFFGDVSLWLLLAVAPNLLTTIWYTVSQGFFQALNKVQAFFYLAFLSGALNSLGIVVLVGFLHMRLAAVVATSVLAGLVTTIVSLAFLLRSQQEKPTVDVATMRRLLGTSKAIHLTAVGYYIFNSSDLLLVNHFRGAQEVAWYKIATFLFTGFVLVPAAMTSSLYALGAKHGVEKAWPIQRRVIVQIVALMTLAALVLYPLWPYVVMLIAGPGFEPATGLTRILMFGLWGLMLSTLLSSQWILRGLFWQATLLTISVAVLNVGLNLWAIPKWGATGAAWVKVASFAIIAAQNIVASLFVFGQRARPSPTDAPVPLPPVPP